MNRGGGNSSREFLFCFKLFGISLVLCSCASPTALTHKNVELMWKRASSARCLHYHVFEKGKTVPFEALYSHLLFCVSLLTKHENEIHIHPLFLLFLNVGHFRIPPEPLALKSKKITPKSS